MNKKTKSMILKAETAHMMFIQPIENTGCKKLSRNGCGVEYCNMLAENDGYVLEAEGSPSDMRKVIKYAEGLGITPLYETAPVFREGRKYSFAAVEGMWVVARVKNGIQDTVEPYVENYANIFEDYKFDKSDVRETIIIIQ